MFSYEVLKVKQDSVRAAAADKRSGLPMKTLTSDPNSLVMYG